MEAELDLMSEDELCQELSRLHAVTLSPKSWWNAPGYASEYMLLRHTQDLLNYHELAAYYYRRLLDRLTAEVKRKANVTASR